jgi:hypothetical protein
MPRKSRLKHAENAVKPTTIMVNGCEVRVDLHYKEACLSDIIAAFSNDTGIYVRHHAADVLYRLKARAVYKQLGIEDKNRVIFPNDDTRKGVITVNAEEFSQLKIVIQLVDSRFGRNYNEATLLDAFNKLVNGSQPETLDRAAGVPSAPPLPPTPSLQLTPDISSVERPSATSMVVQESLPVSAAGPVMGMPMVPFLLPSKRSREDVDLYREMALISKTLTENEKERLDMENVRLARENVRLSMLIKLAELGVDVTKICSVSR